MKEVAKPWMVKVLTDLGTRLLVVIKPHLLVKDLQGNFPVFGACESVHSFRMTSLV